MPLFQNETLSKTSYENDFDLHGKEPVEGKFSYEWFCTKIHFDREGVRQLEKGLLTSEEGRRESCRPIPIVLVKCWKVAHWNAKRLLKNCQKSKKLLPKFQKLLPKFLAIFI